MAAAATFCSRVFATTGAADRLLVGPLVRTMCGRRASRWPSMPALDALCGRVLSLLRPSGESCHDLVVVLEKMSPNIRFDRVRARPPPLPRCCAPVGSRLSCAAGFGFYRRRQPADEGPCCFKHMLRCASQMLCFSLAFCARSSGGCALSFLLSFHIIITMISGPVVAFPRSSLAGACVGSHYGFFSDAASVLPISSLAPGREGYRQYMYRLYMP